MEQNCDVPHSSLVIATICHDLCKRGLSNNDGILCSQKYYSSNTFIEIILIGGYTYIITKIIQSVFNHKCSIITPQRKYLTKFVFDPIIGFHYTSDDYNTMYAISLQENRVFAIYQDVNIKVLPSSKEEYLNKKHKYYESHKLHKKVITESHIGQVVRETLRLYLQL